MTPSWVVRERVACPFTAQMPRNSATELSTTSFFLIILAGKGDIPEVVDQLKPLEDLHFHLNHENGNGRERLETRPPRKLIAKTPYKLGASRSFCDIETEHDFLHSSCRMCGQRQNTKASGKDARFKNAQTHLT